MMIGWQFYFKKYRKYEEDFTKFINNLRMLFSEFFKLLLCTDRSVDIFSANNSADFCFFYMWI